MKKRIIAGCLIFLLVVSVLYIFGLVRACFSGATDKETTICLVSNDCYAYEKSGECFVENSEHEFESNIYAADGTYSEFRVDGYSHIHYLLPKVNGGYYCAAIGEDGLKYLLSLSDEGEVGSFIRVSYLPVKLYESKDGLVAYYIGDSEAEVYYVDFTTGQQNLLIDGISIYGSGWSESLEHCESEQEFFDLYEYKYEEFIKSGKDLLFTLFDEKCFENVYINDNKIAYKTAYGENKDKWIVKQGAKETEFTNSDRCFGFVDENELLFYRSIPMGLYDIGLFYKYDYKKEKKNDFKVMCNQGVGYGTISADKDNLCFIGSWDFGGAYINCMDTETYKHYEIMSNYFGGTFIIVP